MTIEVVGRRSALQYAVDANGNWWWKHDFSKRWRPAVCVRSIPHEILALAAAGVSS
jgi:hypothetical protein